MKQSMQNNSERMRIHVLQTLFVLGLVCMMSLVWVATATAKYGSYNSAEAYLGWDDANTLFETANSVTTSETSPHGGYTQSSFKCVVCHSTHRAYSNLSTAGVGANNSLLPGGTSGGACAQCHTTWGSSPSDALVEAGQTSGGPHIGAGAATCTRMGCHGSVHGTGTPSKYAVVNAYNLNNSRADLDTQLDNAIASGNVNAEINTTNTGQAMKAYATGYVCFPCHGNSSLSIAAKGYANSGVVVGTDTSPRTGHPSTGMSTQAWVPTCEGCHDMIGVATNTTAFPHANRGIDVYEGRFNQYTQAPLTNGTVIKTDNTDSTRYGLWMTSASYGQGANAMPIVDKAQSGGTLGAGMSLRDGSCIKCHNPSQLP